MITEQFSLYFVHHLIFQTWIPYEWYNRGQFQIDNETYHRWKKERSDSIQEEVNNAQ